MMSLLERLERNKGTVSSELGKRIAAEILRNRDAKLLTEAIDLCSHRLTDLKARNVRAGAAKIVELVALERPTLAAPLIDGLLPALESREPQTRWMAIRAFGACAALNQKAARKAFPYAKLYLSEKREGQLCLASSADLYLGDYGSASAKAATEAFPVLLASSDAPVTNEHDWLIESFLKLLPFLSISEKALVADFARGYADHPRKKTRERVKDLIERIEPSKAAISRTAEKAGHVKARTRTPNDTSGKTGKRAPQETPLSDPSVFPSDEALSGVLGTRAKAALDSFLEENRAAYPTFTAEWRFYNDGKVWLMKGQVKKKTVFWLSAAERAFRITCYLGAAADAEVEAGDFPEDAKARWRESSGKNFRGLTIRVASKRDLAACREAEALKLARM